jgi:hypothetical protein
MRIPRGKYTAKIEIRFRSSFKKDYLFYEMDYTKMREMAIQDILSDLTSGKNEARLKIIPHPTSETCNLCSRGTVGVEILFLSGGNPDPRVEYPEFDIDLPTGQKIGMIKCCERCIRQFQSNSCFLATEKCWNCGKRSASRIRRCGRCRTAVYCDRECQLAAWPEHKKECIEISEL